MSNLKEENVQNMFLETLKNSRAPVTIFLVCGVRLQGVVTHFDDKTILLKREGHTQLVFKHSVSTVMPIDPIDIDDMDDSSGKKGKA
jgi:host factor-I protein